ncbi:Hsp20 family protein [Thiorhodococcus fuscus]|uniref:Hsp20 family protein n=1 Tax=Thiorhodococcus fuscus TaxID=527200 RepID=A0ABW4YD42_9GAMM
MRPSQPYSESPMRKILPIAVVLLGMPGLSLAWTPYGPAPYGYPEPQSPFSVPFYGPTWPGYPGTPGVVPQPPGVPGVRSAPSVPQARTLPEGLPQRTLSLWPRLEIRRAMRGDVYVVDVLLQNIAPDAVEVRPAGQGLLIRYDTERRVDRENQLLNGGYASSYSLSHGTASRRVGLPGDADLSAMSTEIEDGVIQVSIPRTAAPNGGWPARP